MADVDKIVDEEIHAWAFDAYTLVRNTVIDNLTGKVLRRDTGRLVNDVNNGSRPEKGPSGKYVGFRLGVRVKYGIGWELGFTVPARTIRPKAGRLSRHPPRLPALRWVGPAGDIVYRHSVFQPERKMAARPFLRPAIENNMAQMEKDLGAAMDRCWMRIFPGGTITVSPFKIEVKTGFVK